MAKPPKSIHAGHRQRVKEEFLATGFTGWSDHRILEFLLFYALPQGDTNEIAHNLINKFGSLSGVLVAPLEELKRTQGVGDHTATFLCSMSSVAAVYTGSRARRNTVVNAPSDAFPLLVREFMGQKNELVYILCLDGKNQVLGIRKIAQGSINATHINIRRIGEEVFALHAEKIYLAHNHVGSLPLPSLADWQTTFSLYGVLNAMGIQLVDHLIFQDSEMVSLQQSESQGRILLPL